jgi:hypothetical protein
MVGGERARWLQHSSTGALIAVHLSDSATELVSIGSPPSFYSSYGEDSGLLHAHVDRGFAPAGRDVRMEGERGSCAAAGVTVD